MKKRMVALYIGMAVLVCVFPFVMPAYSQEDITELADEAFGDRERPAAVFAHEDHNEKAEIEDCSVCHHVYEGGNKVEYESSEDQSCSDCHTVEGEGETRKLMRAYHDLCKKCHKEKKKGPITCGECHPKGGAASSDEAHEEEHGGH
jgi:hypothetical protein